MAPLISLRAVMGFRKWWKLAAHGRGFIYDSDGKTYMDLLLGGSWYVLLLGHRHPKK